MADQLMSYLRERSTLRERQWLAVPRYRQHPCLVVKFRCGHSETSGTKPLTSGRQRCRQGCGLQLIDTISQPRFVTPLPLTRGRP